jgi:cbb3-type cytochrome c oxidase subunit III
MLGVVGLVAFGALPDLAYPAPANDETVLYEHRIEALTATPAGVLKAQNAGKKAAFFCVNCHGDAGVSKLPNVPNLAGQNSAYLMTQIQKFADGRRKDEFMSGLIKVLKDEDRLNMAIYYASLGVAPTVARDARLAQQGKALYARACIGCHGANAHGNRNVARLAGQQYTYLNESLANYRNRKGARTDPVMTSVAANLSDEQIAAIAAYLQTLP